VNIPLQQARRIQMVALDVDGVLTDGGIIIDNAGVEAKRFYVRDGLGIRLLLDSDIQVGLITARNSKVVSRRAEELRLSFVHQGVKDKWSCLQAEMERAGIAAQGCAFMGDDLIDLPILTRIGLATAPADAAPEVLKQVDWVASNPGGRGAVRDLAEAILQAQDKWAGIVSRLTGLK
jgi:3-deoxy-D-manno-octulosonate 8-phosphate phosphatase (KDO 8-P phosphatase)